jgi:predicted nucleotidyltransferase
VYTLVDQRRADIALVCRQYGVRRLAVFGSAARGTDFDPATSDGDVLVAFEQDSRLPPLRRFFGLAEALEGAPGRPVDLVERGVLRNPYILASIERAHEVVYTA